MLATPPQHQPRRRRARAVLAALAAAAVATVVTGCLDPAPRLDPITSSRDPAPGDVWVGFHTELVDHDHSYRCGHAIAYWQSEDVPGKVTQTINPVIIHGWTWHHVFPVQPPGTSRRYLVHAYASNPWGARQPGMQACGSTPFVEYRQTIHGPPLPPPEPPPATPPPPSEPPPAPPEPPAPEPPADPEPPAPPPPPPPVVAPPAPTASFSYAPAPVEIDVRTTFDASASTSGAAITRYDWSFGASAFPQTATGVTAQTTFTATGSFPVTLTVTDELGRTAVRSETITVTDPSAGAGDADRVATAAGRRRPAPGVLLATGTRPVRAGAVTRLFAHPQRGVAPGRRFLWDLPGDGRRARATRTDSILTVFRRPGTRTVRLQMRDARGAVHATAMRVRVRPPRRARQVVRQPAMVRLTSRASERPDLVRYLRRLPGRPRMLERRIADAGALELAAIDRFRPGAERLMAPLVEARTRGRIDVDPASRRFRGTYLLTSTAMRARTCLRVRGTYDDEWVTGRIESVGGTGAARRLRLAGRFVGGAPPDLEVATLRSTLRLSRTRPAGLTAECRALVRR